MQIEVQYIGKRVKLGFLKYLSYGDTVLIDTEDLLNELGCLKICTRGYNLNVDVEDVTYNPWIQNAVADLAEAKLELNKDLSKQYLREAINILLDLKQQEDYYRSRYLGLTKEGEFMFSMIGRNGIGNYRHYIECLLSKEYAIRLAEDFPDLT